MTPVTRYPGTALTSVSPPRESPVEIPCSKLIKSIAGLAVVKTAVSSSPSAAMIKARERPEPTALKTPSPSTCRADKTEIHLKKYSSTLKTPWLPNESIYPYNATAKISYFKTHNANFQASSQGIGTLFAPLASLVITPLVTSAGFRQTTTGLNSLYLTLLMKSARWWGAPSFRFSGALCMIFPSTVCALTRRKISTGFHAPPVPVLGPPSRSSPSPSPSASLPPRTDTACASASRRVAATAFLPLRHAGDTACIHVAKHKTPRRTSTLLLLANARLERGRDYRCAPQPRTASHNTSATQSIQSTPEATAAHAHRTVRRDQRGCMTPCTNWARIAASRAPLPPRRPRPVPSSTVAPVPVPVIHIDPIITQPHVHVHATEREGIKNGIESEPPAEPNPIVIGATTRRHQDRHRGGQRSQHEHHQRTRRRMRVPAGTRDEGRMYPPHLPTGIVPPKGIAPKSIPTAPPDARRPTSTRERNQDNEREGVRRPPKLSEQS
ncbi:hypothetical protein B0H16DRAFT_1738683 [Mycena metata]|uniref:Uncharacterized protein n=1 Tax=Mycena metata TaxID=1033252 RepID=A0AAD7MKA0_9AGAR|nr:hypothetical protein B0H16DRAFT_1738683 [Mycena metata]